MSRILVIYSGNIKQKQTKTGKEQKRCVPEWGGGGQWLFFLAELLEMSIKSPNEEVTSWVCKFGAQKEDKIKDIYLGFFMLLIIFKVTGLDQVSALLQDKIQTP